ncbi:alpha-L-fucosidase [Phycisphaera mikurensis]|uniref:alpha-L-fucosidase n=1 Tax=Phycisphaera mikurensis (strain NBRC 102666 / KCTC 22515 / FYK2301M01) TaxID=1142394 RepID=I0IEV6_PHYMF|nr:alpha-L-fucosidase [Phycisphaera mikurensis]MBB6441589.1 alpha-L-fucosidase [Phycisphaera mikurensis]BAM03794.1 alpha-L-fucosidase [Phycisphaera mikurensis NBRC 102666]
MIATTQEAPGAAHAPDAGAGRFEATWASLGQFEIPDWYRDAKLGIFIHWGVASVPAYKSEWYPKWMYQRDSEFFAYHAETHGPQGTFGFKDFIPGFTMSAWDPAAWAELFEASGARYVVPVAEHHDGIAHYDYSKSRWTTLKVGPRRDLIRELGDAVRGRGLKYGVSSHRAYNWRFYTYEDGFDTTDPAFSDLYARPHAPDEAADEPFLRDWLARTEELVDKYRPDLVWFDWCIGWPEFEPYRRAFAAHYYNAADRWGKEVVVNYKEEDFAPGTGVFDIERGQLDEIRADFWQTDTSISRNGWAYNEDPGNKSATSLLHDLMDVISKNGCLLLNIGPRPDGTITQEQEDVLRTMGAWLRQNGEAVYGTRPWKVFGEGPTRVKAGTFQEKENAGFTPEDLRFTASGDTLYATTLGVPSGDRLLVRSLGSTLKLLLGDVLSVEMLGHDGPLAWERGADGLAVTLPPLDHARHGIALRIRTRPPEAPKRTADAAGSHTADNDIDSAV